MVTYKSIKNRLKEYRTTVSVLGKNGIFGYDANRFVDSVRRVMLDAETYIDRNSIRSIDGIGVDVFFDGRRANVLKNQGVFTLGEALRLFEKDRTWLLKISAVGSSSSEQILCALNAISVIRSICDFGEVHKK